MGKYKRKPKKEKTNKAKLVINNQDETAVYTSESVVFETTKIGLKLSSYLKTLIIFDTNMLREVLGKEVSYSKFSFGRAYDELNDFINDNGLSSYVALTVSTMVIEELKNQKKRAYTQDINDLKEILERLKGMPHVTDDSIQIPDEKFDCEAFVEENAKRFIRENAINTLDFKEEHTNSILQNMIKKVATVDKPKSPFAISGNYKDAGFKDSIIWETLMHYEKIEDFDKVIFLSKDGDYKNNCIEDFKAKWNRHIKIEKDKNNVIVELRKDYGNYIDERIIHDFAQTEYFKDYLFDLLKMKSEIVFNDSNLKIENFSVVNLCGVVDRIPPTDDEDEYIVLNSDMKIYFAENGNKKEQIVIAKTILADDETKEIIETTFDPELI